MADFTIPSFLEDQGVDEIHDRMMSALPEDMDVSEGGHPWNLTMPAAYEKAYMAEFIIPEAIKQIFPMFCEDYADTMDYHAEARNLARKPAAFAAGELTITAEPGVEIPAGSVFSTIGINDEPAIDFATTESVEVDDSGTVKVPIQAVLEGVSGNVPANTIVLNSSSIDDITNVTNEAATEGGIEEETTEALQARIMDVDMSTEHSYVGSESDYKRWALSVQGTGSASIVEPTDDTGVITIVLTDAEGNPADQSLCEAVYNYIMRPDNRAERLAHINDRLAVLPPSTMDIIITATVELAEGSTIEGAKTAFVESLKKYMLEAIEAGEIRYTKIAGVLSDVEAVADYVYSSLTLNGGTDNIPVTEEQAPYINPNNITLTAGVVE